MVVGNESDIAIELVSREIEVKFTDANHQVFVVANLDEKLNQLPIVRVDVQAVCFLLKEFFLWPAKIPGSKVVLKGGGGQVALSQLLLNEFK